MRCFRDELENIINSYSKENGSDTPDFILADYLAECLEVFDRTMARREKWYGRDVHGQSITDPCSVPNTK